MREVLVRGVETAGSPADSLFATVALSRGKPFVASLMGLNIIYKKAPAPAGKTPRQRCWSMEEERQ